ncbi:MAG: hypothetical protein ACK4HV_07780 [Parachlamydiaceae bacterium]
MIEVTWDQAILLYLSILMFSLLVLWFFARRPKVKLSPKETAVCEFCQTPFIKGVKDKYAKCPTCGNFSS